MASDHISPYLGIFITNKLLDKLVLIGLLDGSLTKVKLVADDVIVRHDVTLKEVLYVLDFTCQIH